MINKFDEPNMLKFIRFIHEHENENFEFIYEDGTNIIVNLDSYEGEWDNGLELNDPNYEEYWEMDFEVVKIIKDDKNICFQGKYVSINYHNIPKSYKVIK